MDKARHSSCFAQAGPAVSQAQEPEATGLYYSASVAPQSPTFSAKAFA